MRIGILFLLLGLLNGCSSSSASDETLNLLRTARASEIAGVVGSEADCYLRNSKVTCWAGSVFLESRKPRVIEELREPRELGVSFFKSCALDADGLACWHVMPGDDKVYRQPRLATNERSLALFGDGHCVVGDEGVVCSELAKKNGADENRPVLKNPRQLVASGVLCAIDDEGAKCWGKALPDSGLPAVLPFERPDEIVTNNYVVCLRRGTVVKCFGGGQTDAVRATIAKFSSSNASQVVIAQNSICVLEQGKVRCEGMFIPYEATPKLTYVSKLFANGGAKCALDDVGVHCWGQPPGAPVTRFKF